MTMPNSVEAQAEAIVKAHDERIGFDQSTALLEIADLNHALAIQRAYVDQLRARDGAPAGYKIGLTSRTMQEMCGIDHPVPGRVLRSRVRPSGASISVGEGVRLGIEFEIAVRVGRDLAGTSRSFKMADIASAVDGVGAAFEIVDDRNADYAQLDVLALVADNAWNAGAVLGKFQSTWPDLREVRGTIECDGFEPEPCRGRDVLGHPLAPVVWLANHLAARGTPLQAGEVVLTGSMARTRFVSPGQGYRMTLQGLGAVEVSIVR
jgi:2-keto-4-pentenoate hydratase